MPDQDSELVELQERLAEATARLEEVQAAAADAEARAATLEERSAQAESEAVRLAEVNGAAIADLEEARGQLRDAAGRYREARLTANPEIPPGLVPAGETIEEIERGIEAAQRVVGQLKDRLKEQGAVRAPAGSPGRRGGPDLSSLPASEKIRLGLQQR